MKNRKKIDGGWMCGTDEGIFTEDDGKRFCIKCGKMMRTGQKAIEHRTLEHRTLAQFRRGGITRYQHKICPNIQS